jgi:hypothetical protein
MMEGNNSQNLAEIPVRKGDMLSVSFDKLDASPPTDTKGNLTIVWIKNPDFAEIGKCFPDPPGATSNVKYAIFKIRISDPHQDLHMPPVSPSSNPILNCQSEVVQYRIRPMTRFVHSLLQQHHPLGLRDSYKMLPAKTGG